MQLSAGVECDRGKASRQTAADSAEAAEKKSLRIAEDFSLSRVRMLSMKDGVVNEEYYQMRDDVDDLRRRSARRALPAALRHRVDAWCDSGNRLSGGLLGTYEVGLSPSTL